MEPLSAHLVSVDDGAEEAFALTPECGTQALWAADQQTDDQVGVFLHTLACRKSKDGLRRAVSMRTNRFVCV